MKTTNTTGADALANPNATEPDEVVTVTDSAIITSSPQPWEKPVDGGAVLAEIVKQIKAHMSIGDASAVAVALWIMYSYVYNAFRISPILGVVSPVRRCGKTTLLTILGFLGQRVLSAARVTAAAVYRAVDAHAPTLLVDEADTFLNERGNLRGILNSGHTHETAYVVLTENKMAKKFATWCPKVIAMIGSLPSTLEDRAVVIPLRRKAKSEEVEKLHPGSKADFDPLASKIARWAQDNAGNLAGMNPAVPDKLHDRAGDNWTPLLAVAELIGGDWPQRARKAALQLSGAGTAQNAGNGEMLIHDIRRILTGNKVEKIDSAHLVAALAEMEDRPWPELCGGRPITKAKLAVMLRPFGIAPKLLREGKAVYRGYVVADFRDAFERYAA